MTLQEVTTAAKEINQLVDPEANLIFGAVVDDSLNGQVSITLIATGFHPMNGEVRDAGMVVVDSVVESRYEGGRVTCAPYPPL